MPNHPNRKPTYKIRDISGRFDHVRGIEAALKRANEIAGVSGYTREALDRDFGVRIERVSAEIARSVGL